MNRAVERLSRAMRGGLFVCTAILASLGFAVSSEAQQNDFYLIIDGPGFGVQLVTNHGELTVLPSSSALAPTGHIGGITGDHCNGALHFHGTITQRADPDPVACGWGKVARLDAPTPLQLAMTSAIGAEHLAHSALGQMPPNYSEANRLLIGSSDALSNLKAKVAAAKENGDIDQQTADRITRQIDVAIKTEQRAVDALIRLKDGAGQPKDQKVAERDLRTALDDKARVFRSLRKAKLIP